MPSLLDGDTKRTLAKREVRDPEGNFVKTAQRVWLSTKRSGIYVAELKDSAGNVVESLEIPLVVPEEGSGEIEMRLQVYPIEAQ